MDGDLERIGEGAVNEMIERVARAICIRCGGVPDRMAFQGIPEYGPRNSFIYIPNDESWQKPRPLWQFFTSEASAAIQAMREPTQYMIDACDLNIPIEGTIIDIWTDMIDASLEY